MKAIVCHQYGSPNVLKLDEVQKPTPRDDEVLIIVHATSANAADWHILGGDIAGRVEAVGRNVKQFQPGDEVFGDISGCGRGGFAEYVCARENALALKPASMKMILEFLLAHAPNSAQLQDLAQEYGADKDRFDKEWKHLFFRDKLGFLGWLKRPLKI